MKFPSKILLFGEYTVVVGGSALAIPFWKYTGQWQDKGEGVSLIPFYKQLKTIDGADRTALEAAIRMNRTFQSSIPMGFGLGSSGALTAAAYKSFFMGNDQELVPTKSTLAQIESFFHGQSSGMDPMTCYYQQPIYMQGVDIRIIDQLQLPAQLKLYNSQQARHSKPLIELFKQRLDNDTAYKHKVEALSKINQSIIEALIAGNDISSYFKDISSLEYELFFDMIPQQLRPIWSEGIASDKYYMKLSGAGGGGYFLVYELEDSGLDLENIS